MADDSVLFRLQADISDLKAKLAEADTTIQTLKAKTEKADDEGLGFKKSVTAVKSWIGAVGGAIAVATSMFVLGQKIRAVYDDLFTSGAEKAKKFSESLLITDATDRLKAYTAEIDKLQTRLAQSLEDPISNILNRLQGLGPQSLMDQIAALEASRSDAQQQANRQREVAEEKAAKEKAAAEEEANRKRIDAMEATQRAEEQANEEARQRRTQQALDDANTLADATLSEEEKIARKRFDNIERAKRLLTQAVTEQDRFAAESLIKAANLNARFELKKLEDEREKKRLETEKKAADKYADTLEDRLRKFYDEINRANREFGTTLGDRLNGTLEAIRQDINRIRLTIPQNGGGGYPPGGSY